MSDIHGIVALAAAFAETVTYAAIYVDATGAIRSWNQGAEVLFGHSALDAIGRRADIIVPEPLRDVHWAGFERAVLSPWRGSGSWTPIEPVHADGSPLALEVFLLPLAKSPPESLRGILALFRARDADHR
jgi:PAS domain S-box-containing protein